MAKGKRKTNKARLNGLIPIAVAALVGTGGGFASYQLLEWRVKQAESMISNLSPMVAAQTERIVALEQFQDKGRRCTFDDCEAMREAIDKERERRNAWEARVLPLDAKQTADIERLNELMTLAIDAMNEQRERIRTLEAR